MGPTHREVHAQTVGAEPEAIPGEPGATKEVAHAHHDRAEPDLQGQPGDSNVNTPKGVALGEPDSMPGEETDPNANTLAHLECAEQETLINEEDRSLKVEEGIAGENASVEGDMGPCIELAVITTTHHPEGC